MGKLIWSEDAFFDLDAITDFILKDLAVYSQIVGEAILDAAESALEEPYRGRMVPELGQKEFREKLVYSYRFIYRVTKNEDVEVIAILSGSQLILPIVGSRL